MTYVVTQLITDAYYTSGIVGREFETISGSQLNDGLIFLNSLLAKKTADKGAIPYFMRYDNFMSPGVEMYYIPGLISVDTLTFFIPNNQPPTPPNNVVRYAIRKVDRKLYWGSPRANNIMSLPYIYTVERQFGGANIYFYFLPNTNYQYELWGLFSLMSVTLNQDLSLTIDQFYIDFLKFELAKRICVEFNFAFPPGPADELSNYQLIIDQREQQMDLYQQTISPLSNNADGLSYAWANLGNGFGVPY
jgi:hypothetical protein